MRRAVVLWRLTTKGCMIPSFVNPELASQLIKREVSAESVLQKWANIRGLELRRSTPQQDMRDHIDFFICGNGAEISVDLKGEKAGQERGLYLVEIKNVQGRTSWLNGRADYIAFQEGNTLLFIDRQKLADSFVNTSWKRGNKFCRAPYYYARYDRPLEMVSWIDREELIRYREEF